MCSRSLFGEQWANTRDKTQICELPIEIRKKPRNPETMKLKLGSWALDNPRVANNYIGRSKDFANVFEPQNDEQREFYTCVVNNICAQLRNVPNNLSENPLGSATCNKFLG